MNSTRKILLLLAIFLFVACGDDHGYRPVDEDSQVNSLAQVVTENFSDNIDFENLENYANQTVPNYINKDNTGANSIQDDMATLGRILFYDKNLSTDNSIACASCHQQAFAFSDFDDVSTGVNGTTGRHSMRLINARFADESRFFWDERAATLEIQTTQPIQDHAEMGFSGENGDPSFDDLIVKLSGTDYYPLIFQHIYGDENITEARMQECLAQFVRSIQSFDSKFDEGLVQVNNINQDFPNYTAQENQGKRIYLDPPNQGGAGCMGCHRAPEFDIDPNSGNNGVIGVFGSIDTDELVTRAPTLRDLFDSTGRLNGALMHDASFDNLVDVIEHYNVINPDDNQNLDNRLRGGPGQNGQHLNLDAGEIAALEAFIKTLSGTAVYSHARWSDPFN